MFCFVLLDSNLFSIIPHTTLKQSNTYLGHYAMLITFLPS